MADEDFEKELKGIQHKLAASEVRYRKLFETAKDGILLIDPVTEKVIDANPFLLEMIGYSLDDVIGKKLWEIGAIKDIEASKKLFEELQEKGYVHYEGLPLQSKDGKEHEVEFVSNKYRVDGTKMIQCNIRDITDRKMAEKETASTLEKLKDELALNDLIYQTSPFGILMYNAQSGKCIFVNDAAAKEVGAPKEELLQQNFRKIKSWKNKLLSVAEDALTTGDIQTAEEHMTTTFGKEVWLEATFTSFKKNGEKFLLFIVHNILKRKKLEEELKKQVDELECTNRTMVGRELKMMELKAQIEDLEKKLAAK